MIALTGYGMEDDLAKYREAGFSWQLIKPIRFEQLEEVLDRFIANPASFGQEQPAPTPANKPDGGPPPGDSPAE
ncbi:MAG: hypothetical protein PHC88_11095 [Terrimicrobiaceae bacterium]|nr:hypothetical protein [Terrimicrobiaceae bacterium]